jgi:hypothetical protein
MQASNYLTITCALGQGGGDDQGCDRSYTSFQAR